MLIKHTFDTFYVFQNNGKNIIVIFTGLLVVATLSPPDTSSESEEEYVDDNDESEPDIVLLPDNQDDADEVRVIGQSISPSSIRPPSPDIIEIVAVDQDRPWRPPLGPAKTPSRKRQGPQNPGPSDRPQNL